MYKYTKSWFLHSEVRILLPDILDTSAIHRILEIGCFEGLSSVFFADLFLGHSESSMTCVDPFMGLETNDHKKFLENGEEKNFDHNIKTCKNAEKIQVYKVTSDEFFKTNNSTYTFIYIDGCHECENIKRDMENAHEVLERGGIMWMDDYGGGNGDNIRNTMNSFVGLHKDEYEIIHSGYQLALKKL